MKQRGRDATTRDSRRDGIDGVREITCSNISPRKIANGNRAAESIRQPGEKPGINKTNIKNTMKKIICEIADNGGVIIITDMNDGTTPNQFAAFTTASEAKSSFCSMLDAMTSSGVTVAAAPVEQAAQS